LICLFSSANLDPKFRHKSSFSPSYTSTSFDCSESPRPSYLLASFGDGKLLS
jgi:hypothetical protein